MRLVQRLRTGIVICAVVGLIAVYSSSRCSKLGCFGQGKAHRTVKDALPNNTARISTFADPKSSKLSTINWRIAEKPALPAAVKYNDTNPLPCARLHGETAHLPNSEGRVLCRLKFTEFFQNVIKETLMVVDTPKQDQPFDGYLWHRCVVFGRFEKVVTQHIDDFDGKGNYDRSLLMVRGDFSALWKRFKSVTKKDPGVLLWADELCEPKVNMAEAKYSFRHYGCLKDTTSNYIPNGFWRWKFGKAPPLGARDGENQINTDSSCEGSSDLLKASARKHFFNWQGTLRRNRQNMVSSAQAAYKTSDAADARYYISARGSGFDGDGNSFQDAVLNSAFTLCPCGNNAETHRLWEALLAGSIPVQEDCGDSESQIKFLTFIKNVLPDVIFIRNWNDLPKLLGKYENDEAELNKKQLSMYSSFITFMVRLGTDAGDIVTGAKVNITWPNAAASA